MQTLKLNSSRLEYPVGQNVLLAINMAKEAASAFIQNINIGNCDGVLVYCSGSSGAILASLFINELFILNPNINATLIHVKKDGEISHATSYRNFFNPYNVIIDDFISTGTTINRIINKENLQKVNCLIVLGGWSRLNHNTWSNIDYIISTTWLENGTEQGL